MTTTILKSRRCCLRILRAARAGGGGGGGGAAVPRPGVGWLTGAGGKVVMALEIVFAADPAALANAVEEPHIRIFSGTGMQLEISDLSGLQKRMATGSEAGKSAEAVLEWNNQDKKRMLHAVYRVGDLDRTIKYYTECFGMKLLRKRDVPEEKYTNAFLGFGPEDTNFALELTYNYGVDKYDIGAGFGHFAIANEDVYKLADNIKSKGGKITREPGPVKGGSTVIAFAQDPDGYLFELIQRGPTPEPLCQVMLRVGDLDRSIKFYEKALGMKLLRKKDVPDYKYTIAMLGYADEDKTTVLELTYNYGVTEYSKGNAYAQVAIGTNDVYKSAEAVDLATKELGGKILRQPGPLPGINTKITSFVDPDGWKVVLVDHADFLKELH
ncbi:hypothetical protein ACP4OV_027080 [Aristida adscensionis]